MSLNFKNPSRLLVWLYSFLCPLYGRPFYKELLKALDIKGGESILDFGSGAGILANKLIKDLTEEENLTCLDASSAFLNKTRRKLRKFDNVTFLLGDIRELNIQPGSFDIITISWVIHHLPKDALIEIVNAIVHTLKPEGRIYVIEYTSTPHGMLKADLIELFKRVGLGARTIHEKKNTILLEFIKKH